MHVQKSGKALLGIGVLVAAGLKVAMPAAAQTSDGGLPPRAEVIYRGTTDAKIGERARVSVRVPRRLTVRGVVGAIDVPNSRRTSGAVVLRMRFDGAAVTARMSGTGALRPDSLSGAVENGVCRLSNADGTSVWEGRCDARGFSGTFKSNASGGLVIDGRFETSAERVSDLALAQPSTPPPSRETGPRPHGSATVPSDSIPVHEATPAWWRNRVGESGWTILFAVDSMVFAYDAQRARRAGGNQILVDFRIDTRLPKRMRSGSQSFYDGSISRSYLDCTRVREMVTLGWFVRGSTVVDTAVFDPLEWKEASPGSGAHTRLTRVCGDLRGGVALRPVDPADQVPAAGRRRTTATVAAPAPAPAVGLNLDTTRLTGLPASGKATFQLTASMSNIDDIGEIYVLSDGADGRYALVCAWSGGVPGEGSVGLDSYLNVGKNLVLFALYDRRVVGFASVLTPGRWGYRFQLSDHAGPLWSATGAGATNGEGFRYVHAIYIRREPTGVIRVMPQVPLADRARIRESIVPRLARGIEGGGLGTTDLAGRSTCQSGGWSEVHSGG